MDYPYLPQDRIFRFVPETNPFMWEAREYARLHALDTIMPTGAVVVKDRAVIGRGANGSDYHLTHECERVKRGIPTGQGYELCEGCHPKNHSERRAIEDAQTRRHDTHSADLYLWGHWWACKPCWDAMIMAGIANVYLLEHSEELFNKSSKNNIIGRQIA